LSGYPWIRELQDYDYSSPHLHFGLRVGFVHINPLIHFADGLRAELVSLMVEDGGYGGTYNAYSMYSFDASSTYTYTPEQTANYWFWGGCDPFAGIVWFGPH
jgi:hypothetical protein